MTEEKISSVNDDKQVQDKEGGSVNLGRHQAQCSVCLHPHIGSKLRSILLIGAVLHIFPDYTAPVVILCIGTLTPSASSTNAEQISRWLLRRLLR